MLIKPASSLPECLIGWRSRLSRSSSQRTDIFLATTDYKLHLLGLGEGFSIVSMLLSFCHFRG